MGTTDITTITINTNVDQARLQGNEFGTIGIPANYFQNLPNLAQIRLDLNKLQDTSIPDFCFTGVASSLIKIYLNSNLLTQIRTHQFDGLYILRSLLLQNNTINNIQDGKSKVTSWISLSFIFQF